MRDLGTRFWVLIDYVNHVPLKEIAHRRSVDLATVQRIAREEFAPLRTRRSRPKPMAIPKDEQLTVIPIAAVMKLHKSGRNGRSIRTSLYYSTGRKFSRGAINRVIRQTKGAIAND